MTVGHLCVHGAEELAVAVDGFASGVLEYPEPHITRCFPDREYRQAIHPDIHPDWAGDRAGIKFGVGLGLQVL